MIEVYFDGACEPYNPRGIATFGFIVFRNKKVIKEGYGLACEPFSYKATNNFAEYMGLIKALKFLVIQGLTKEETIVRGDSKLVINQVLGIYSVKSSNLIPLHNIVVELMATFENISFEWIPREKNSLADELSHRAYVEFLDNNPRIVEKIRKALATKKQINFLKRLGYQPYKYMSKRDASRIIRKELNKKLRSIPILNHN